MLTEKEYESIILKNDKFTEDTEIALGLVKKYVIKNKLIIVGGMAIDMALRLKGDNLYDDDVLPDYDFYSPYYNFDAYKIAELLHAAGLKNISVINANHISTMRVRVNYTVVADVTYMPKIIFDNLPTLFYRDVHIIHPHYQMIDQHRALSMPYENAPWEVITHRWKKDAIRYDIICKYYPIKLDDSKEYKIILTDVIKISSISFKNECISGFAGLLYWHNLAMKYGFKESTDIGTISVDIVGMVVQIPEDSHGITIYSDNINTLYSNIKKDSSTKKVRRYNRFLDKLPNKIIIDNKWELFDNSGYMISAHKLDNDIYIANLQNIMLYMLTNLILLQKINDFNRGNSFYIGYLLAQSLVKWAGKEYSSKKNNKFIVFLPSAEVYGKSDISDSYLNAKRLFLIKIKTREKDKLQPNVIFPESFVKGKIPKKYYDFNPENSIILQFDGSLTDESFDRINFANST